VTEPNDTPRADPYNELAARYGYRLSSADGTNGFWIKRLDQRGVVGLIAVFGLYKRLNDPEAFGRALHEHAGNLEQQVQALPSILKPLLHEDRYEQRLDLPDPPPLDISHLVPK
jgi:hypothetical protein